MTIPQDSAYRRAIDYGVFTILVIVFAVAVLRRVYRSVEVDQTLVVTRSSPPQSQPVTVATESEPGDKPSKRRTRLDPDRLTRADLEPPEESIPPDEPPEPPGPPLTRRAIEIKINPNTATWWELAELPGIGEVKGRAIVSYREQFRREALADDPRANPPPAFTKPEDLDAVKGIGPATVEKMRPMLVFDRQPAPTKSLRPRLNK